MGSTAPRTPTNADIWQVVGSELQNLGLTESEIETYRFLSSAGSSTPTVVARATRTSRGRIYASLRRLCDAGLAREEAVRPRRFMGVPLADVLQTLAARADERASFLSDAKERWTGPHAPVREAREGAGPGAVTLVSGRRAVLAEVRRLALQAAGRFVFVGTGRAPRRLAQSFSLLAEVRASLARHVKIQLLLSGSEEVARDYQFIADELGQTNVTALGPSLPDGVLVVANERVLLLVFVSPDDASPLQGQDLGIRIALAPAAAAAFQFANLASARSIPYQAQPPRSLQDDLVHYVRRVDQAQTEVIGMGPPGLRRLLRKGGSGLEEALHAALGRGVRLRALTTTRGENDVPNEPSPWETRTVPELPVWVSIIDGQFLFQAFPPTANDEMPTIRVSEVRGEVQFYQDWFDRLWNRAGAKGEGRPDADGNGAVIPIRNAPSRSVD